MKKIKLPIRRAFTTKPINYNEAIKKLASDKSQTIPLGNINFANSQELDQARINGGLIIWCAICLEQKMEEIITNYIFRPSNKHNELGRSFFLTKIVKSDLLPYSAKKKLLIDIINDVQLIEGPTKDKYFQDLKSAMDFRNAFAHGDIFYETDSGCILTYWQSGHKRAILNDSYWEKVEMCFNNVHSLSDGIIEKLKSNNILSS